VRRARGRGWWCGQRYLSKEKVDAQEGGGRVERRRASSACAGRTRRALCCSAALLPRRRRCGGAAKMELNLRLPSKVELNSKQNGETAKRRNGDGQPAKISGTGRRRGGKREGNHVSPLRSMPPRIPGEGEGEGEGDLVRRRVERSLAGAVAPFLALGGGGGGGGGRLEQAYVVAQRASRGL